MIFLMDLKWVGIEFVNIDLCVSNPEARYCDKGYSSSNLERLDHLCNGHASGVCIKG
jgi:hypothetical protein